MTKHVLYFIAGFVPTMTETNAIAALALDPGISVGVRSVLFADAPTAQSGPEPCDGVAGAWPATGSYVNNYSAAVTAGTILDYSAEAAGGPAALVIVAGGSLTFAHTATKQLSAVAEAAGGAMSDVTTSVAWSSATPGVATVGASTGLVTGVAAGTSVITAAYTVNSKVTTKTATVTLT